MSHETETPVAEVVSPEAETETLDAPEPEARSKPASAIDRARGAIRGLWARLTVALVTAWRWVRGRLPRWLGGRPADAPVDPIAPTLALPVSTMAVVGSERPDVVEAELEEILAHPDTRVLAPLAELKAVDITAWFGDHQVLDRVSLTMPSGVITSLIGPSGCGKSTFLRILNRMHELIPSASLAGEVLLDGVDIYSPDRRLVDARKSIGMVFQKPNPFPAMSIYDNVIAGLKLTGVSASRDHRDYLVESCLTKAGLWKEVKDRLRAPGGGLSGGQQQRLCIARSLAVAPRVLLMDEPCSALDPTSTRVIEETMLELAREVTIVIVTHNMQQAQRVSTQCAFFLASQGKPGGIVEFGDTDVMFDSPTDSRTYDYVNGRFG
jgi:phosphate transport system ATP-binding protein